MTNNFQPSEDIFDDVEGHGRIGVEAETPQTDDVEGHLGGKTVPLEAEDNEKSWQR